MSEIVDKSNSNDEAKFCNCTNARVEKLTSSELVCTSCGSVRDSVELIDKNDLNENAKFLSSEHNAFPVQGRISNNLFLHDDTKKRLSEGRLASVEIIRRLATACNLDYHMTVRARKLLDNIFGKYRKNNSDFRLLMGASCVYHVLKEQRKPIELTEFCKHLGKNQQTFLSVYRQLCKKLGLEAITTNMEDQVKIALKNISGKTPEERQRKREIIDKTIEILNLAENYWLKNSYSKRHCILAAAYFAWRLSDLSNKNCGFDSFYYLYDFEITRSRAAERVRDLYKLFIKLASHIPYIDKSLITKKYVVFYLKDILKSSEYLLGCVNAVETKELEEVAKNHKQPVKVECVETDNFDFSVSDEKLIPDSEWDLYIRSEEEVSKIESQLENKERERSVFM